MIHVLLVVVGFSVCWKTVYCQGCEYSTIISYDYGWRKSNRIYLVCYEMDDENKYIEPMIMIVMNEMNLNIKQE